MIGKNEIHEPYKGAEAYTSSSLRFNFLAQPASRESSEGKRAEEETAIHLFQQQQPKKKRSRQHNRPNAKSRATKRF